MIDSLYQIDIHILGLINQTLTHPWFDFFFKTITDLHKNPIFVSVGIAVLLLFSIRKYGRQAWRPLLGLIVAIAISDVVSYRILKKAVERPRPFQSESLHNVRQLTDAHGNSFPSNHAANCFAAAIVLGFCFPRRRYLFYIFAALVGYSRIYLGVHYPSDVLAGAGVGLIVGYLVSIFTVIQLKHWSPPEA